jgi:glycosyltransferase involved in cell wall biosynthesis
VSRRRPDRRPSGTATGSRRILVVTSSFPESAEDSRNAGVFVVDLATLLAEEGCEVVVMSPQRSRVRGPFAVRSFPRLGDEPSLTHLDPRTVGGLVKLASVVLGGAVSVPWTARHRRIDHVLALWAVPSGVFALLARILVGTPYSVWALGSDIWRIRDYPGGRTVLRAVLRRSSRTYADGVGLCADVAAISGRPCEFLATSRILPVEDRRLWDDGARHVVTIARFHEHKGVDVLVEALAGMDAAELDGLVVHVFGDGPQRGQLEAAVVAGGLDRVVVLEGFADERVAAAALRSADLAVVPSRVESIPLVLSDICNASPPMVVVTDAGDMGDLVARFGAGRVARAGDAASLRAELRAALRGDGAGDATGRAELAEHLSLRRSVLRFLGDIGLDVGTTEDPTAVGREGEHGTDQPEADQERHPVDRADEDAERHG